MGTASRRCSSPTLGAPNGSIAIHRGVGRFAELVLTTDATSAIEGGSEHITYAQPVGDVDADGTNDLLTLNSATPAEVVFVSGASLLDGADADLTSDGLRVLIPSAIRSNVVTATSGDFDGDGYDETVLGFADAGGNGAIYLLPSRGP